MQSRCRNGSWTVLGALLLMCAPTARAVDGIVLEVRELSVAGIPVEGASVRLDILPDETTRLTVRADSATITDPVGKLTGISLVCEQPVIAEPRFACDRGRLAARGGPTGNLDMTLAASFDTGSAVATFSGNGLAVAGTTASFQGRLDDRGWSVKGGTGVTSVAALREFARPWFELPADITGDGKAAVTGAVSDHGRGTDLDVTLNLEDVSLTNEASTIVTDGMAASARVLANLEADTDLRLAVHGTKGQVLVGPVLLDFAQNPMDLDGVANLKGEVLVVSELKLAQQELLDLTGTARVNLAGETPAIDGDFKIARLQFPAAYTSYMQITLAGSMLSDLDSSGEMSGEVQLRDSVPTLLHLSPRKLVLRDRKGQLHLKDMEGEVWWTPAGVEAPYSRLAWSEGGAFGLYGGAAQMEFVARGTNFAVMKPTKLPILDGALAIETFSMGDIGAKDMVVQFKGAVLPISMPQLAKVFGWPEFQGTVAATIPGVTLKNDVLTFEGNVESEVFGGRVVGSNIRLQDPLGNFPQFFADVRARDLDLGLVTQTFEVGSITGKLEADVLNLELFAWSPVSFDARLATPKGDKSRHRISAKAVSSLSNVGGGGGGVVQALQSGVLRFFDEYSYDKLGITCRLRNDVCEMSGVEPAGIGYYIVKGSGLPRIDIVGNAGRVRWSQLVSSISTTNFGDATTE